MTFFRSSSAPGSSEKDLESKILVLKDIAGGPGSRWFCETWEWLNLLCPSPALIFLCHHFRLTRRSCGSPPRSRNSGETWGTLYNRVGVVKRHVECLRSARPSPRRSISRVCFLLIRKL